MAKYNSQFNAVVNLSNGAPNRFLDYLAFRFTYKTKKDWETLIKAGIVSVAHRESSPELVLKAGEKISFKVVDYEEPPVPTDVVYLGEENGLLAFHKPMGMPVHKTGRIFFNTLVNWVRERHSNPGLNPIHRLDRETGGIVFFRDSALPIQKKGAMPKIHKWYLAYVTGTPGQQEGFIEQALGTLAHSPIRCQMHPLEDGKPSLTYYKVLEQKGGHSCILVYPITGRKHQIRAHLSFLGCPIVGDKIYSLGGKYYLERLNRELTEEDFKALGALDHQLFCFAAVQQNREKENKVWLDSHWESLIPDFSKAAFHWLKGEGVDFLKTKTGEINSRYGEKSA